MDGTLIWNDRVHPPSQRNRNFKTEEDPDGNLLMQRLASEIGQKIGSERSPLGIPMLEPSSDYLLSNFYHDENFLYENLLNFGSNLNSPSMEEDTTVGVVMSNLPVNTSSRQVRDLLEIHGVGSDHPVYFVISNSVFIDSTSAVILLPDIKETAQAAHLLNNIEFAGRIVGAKALYKSVYVGMKLSTEAQWSPYPSSSSGSDEVEFSFDNISRQIHWQINPPETTEVRSVPTWPQLRSLEMSLKDEPSNPKTVFIGNIPSDTEIEQLRQLVKRHVDGVKLASTYQVAKKAEWDYAFINCILASDAKTIHDLLQKARFSGCILDVNFYDNQRHSTSGSNGSNSPTSVPFDSSKQHHHHQHHQKKIRQSAGAVPQNCNSTNVYVGNLPSSIEFHEFFVAVYPTVTSVAGSDFALYRQSQWRHGFFNFPNAAKAMAANSCLNGLEIAGAVLAANMAEGRAKFTASSRFANIDEFELSLNRPSTILRIDNVDGALSNADIKVMFPEAKEFWRDYPTAYIRVADEQVAAAVLRRTQGRLVRNAALVVCYVNRKQ